MIPCQKHLFHIPEDITFLNCSYMSPQLRSVSEAGQKGLQMKEMPWELTPTEFFTTSEKARQCFARLIDAQAEDIAIIPAASYGLSLAAKNLTVKPGEHILVLAEQFPSNVYPWQALAQEKQATVQTVPRPENDDWTEAILASLQKETAIVALPHCHWTDGGLVDLVKVREHCDALEAALVVDATQSLGALPFSVKTIRPDFLIAPTYKWLLGPYSLGFMYVAPAHQGGEPLEYNWIQRKESENFASLVNYREDYQPGAQRFDVGERSNFALMPMAVAALEQILEWGVVSIEKTLAALTQKMAEEAEALQLNVCPNHLRASHMLGLRFPHGVPQTLLQHLEENKIYVSVRGNSIRLSPHLYNDLQDVERLFEVLKNHS